MIRSPDAPAASPLPPPGSPFRAVVLPGPQVLRGVVRAQPSKNYTTRWLLAAALADGESVVRNAATSEDAAAMVRCLRALGADVEVRENGDGSADVRIRGFGARPVPVGGAPLNVGNAGAVLRFLLAVGALCPEVRFETDRPDSLGRRPNGDLLDALERMGVSTGSDGGMLPVTLSGGPGVLRSGRVSVSGARSSQFLSGLLFLAPLVGEPVEIEVTERLVSREPVRQTLEVLERAGVRVDASADLMRFRVEPQAYQPGEFHVNGDWPGSSALLAAGALVADGIGVEGLLDDRQGEREAADVLAAMGALLSREGNEVRVARGPLRAVDFDGDTATDAVLALLGPACFAEGRSRFHNVANLRIKECDRISEPLAELRKVGVRCWEGHELGDADPDAIIIEGDPEGYEGGVTVDGRKDHRVIMLLVEVGLRCRKGLTITGAEHVAKSYPRFFHDLVRLGARLRFDAAGDQEGGGAG